MTTLSATLRLTSASSRQLLRSNEIWATTLLFPGALLAILWLFSELAFEFSSTQVAPLMDFWATGLGVLGIALGNSHAFLANVANWKAGGVLKRVSATPVSAGQLIIGEVIPRAVLGMLTVVVFLAVANLLGASVRLARTMLALLPVMAMVTATGLSVSFIISGVSQSPQNANALDTAVAWPLYLLTGAMFPLGAFPEWLQSVARFIPYTGLIATVRGLVLEGRPLADFGFELAIGTAWIVLLMGLAARAYRFVQ